MDNSTLPPWDHIDPALTPEHLSTVADMIREETDAKIAARDRRDWNWNFGCDCHAWVLNRIHCAAKAECADWLFMESRVGDLDLEFRIGGKNGVLVKYYQPESPGQPQRTLKSVNDELRVIQEVLGRELAPESEPAVRFAAVKSAEGRVIAVRLVQLSLAGELLYSWPVWTADASVFPIDNLPQSEGVELDEPIVTLPEDEESSEADEKDSKGGA